MTRGISIILAEKGTLGAPVSEWVAPHHFGCSCGPMERIIFLDFSGSGMQIEGEQNAVSANPTKIPPFSIQGEVKEAGRKEQRLHTARQGGGSDIYGEVEE